MRCPGTRAAPAGWIARVLLATVNPAFTLDYDWEQAQNLFPGIDYVHCDAAHLRFYATPRSDPWTAQTESPGEAMRQTTRDFIRMARATERKLVVAVNACGWTPWPAPYNALTPASPHGNRPLLGQPVRLLPDDRRPSDWFPELSEKRRGLYR
jgi:hypothetical protein